MSETRVRIITFLWWLLLAGVIVGCVDHMAEKGLSLLGSTTNGIDDANIYFRYARNILAGHGFVWNVGGERVEGVSSLLWLLVCIGVEGLSTYPERALLRCNIVVVAFSVWAAIATVTYVALTRYSGPRSRSHHLLQGSVVSATTTALMVWWLLVNPPFIVWSILSLMDTGVWGALVTILGCSATCYAVSGRAVFRNTAYVSLILFPLCRPEGAVVVVLGVALLLVAEWGRGLIVDRSRRFMLRTVVVGVLSIVSLFSFRLLYFGFLFPNTYYAKVDGDLWFNVSEGWRYLVSFTHHYPQVWIAAVVLVSVSVAALLIDLIVGAVGVPRRYPSTFLFWGVLILVGSLVPVVVGGDHFPWWRFLQPYWIALFVGLLLFADRVLPEVVPPVIRALVVYPLIIGVVVYGAPHAGERWDDFRSPSAPYHEFTFANQGRSMGADLNEVFAGNADLPVVGALAMGGLGQSYRGPINDLLGLNNVEMAHASTDRKSFIKSHAAFDTGVFLRQRPAFLFFMADYCSLASPERTLETNSFYARALKGIHESATFRELYAPVVIWSERLYREGRGLCGYALREELAAGTPSFGYRILP